MIHLPGWQSAEDNTFMFLEPRRSGKSVVAVFIGQSCVSVLFFNRDWKADSFHRLDGEPRKYSMFCSYKNTYFLLDGESEFKLQLSSSEFH